MIVLAVFGAVDDPLVPDMLVYLLAPSFKRQLVYKFGKAKNDFIIFAFLHICKHLFDEISIYKCLTFSFTLFVHFKRKFVLIKFSRIDTFHTRSRDSSYEAGFRYKIHSVDMTSFLPVGFWLVNNNGQCRGQLHTYTLAPCT